MDGGDFNRQKAFKFGVGAVVGKKIFDSATQQNNKPKPKPKPKPIQPIKKIITQEEYEKNEKLREQVREIEKIQIEKEQIKKKKEEEEKNIIKNKNDNTNFYEIDEIKKLRDRFKKIFEAIVFKFEYIDLNTDIIYLIINDSKHNIKFKLNIVNVLFEFIMYNFIDYKEIKNYLYLYNKINFSKEYFLFINPLYYTGNGYAWRCDNDSERKEYQRDLLKIFKPNLLSIYVNESLENIIFKEKLEMEKKEYLEYTKLEEYSEHYDGNYTKMIIFSDINQEIIYDTTCIVISYNRIKCIFSLLEFNCLIKFLKEKKLFINFENFIIFGEIIHKKKNNINIIYKFSVNTNESFLSDLEKSNNNHDTIIKYTSDVELYDKNIFLTDKKVIMDTLNENIKKFNKSFFNKFKSFFGFSGGYSENYSEKYSEKYLNNDTDNIKNEEYKQKYLKYKKKYLDLKKNM